MKLAKRLIVIVIVLLVVVAVGLSLFIDSIARTTVEQGAGYAMDVPTTLDAADVRLFAGDFSLTGLNVSNPAGYESDHFLKLAKGDMNVSLNTLMDDTVVVPTLHLDDVNIILEKTGDKSNLDVIMANVGRLQSDKPATEGGKKYKINEIVITNVTVQVIMPPMGTAAKPMVVKVPEVRLTDVGSDTENGVMLSQLMGTIVATTVRTVVMNAPDVFGNLVVASVDGALAKAGDLGKVGGQLIGQASEITGQATKVLGDVTEQGQKVLEGIRGDDAGKAVEETTKNVGEAVKGLGNLLKKEEPKPAE